MCPPGRWRAVAVGAENLVVAVIRRSGARGPRGRRQRLERVAWLKVPTHSSRRGTGTFGDASSHGLPFFTQVRAVGRRRARPGARALAGAAARMARLARRMATAEGAALRTASKAAAALGRPDRRRRRAAKRFAEDARWDCFGGARRCNSRAVGGGLGGAAALRAWPRFWAVCGAARSATWLSCAFDGLADAGLNASNRRHALRTVDRAGPRGRPGAAERRSTHRRACRRAGSRGCVRNFARQSHRHRPTRRPFRTLATSRTRKFPNALGPLGLHAARARRPRVHLARGAHVPRPPDRAPRALLQQGKLRENYGAVVGAVRRRPAPLRRPHPAALRADLARRRLGALGAHLTQALRSLSARLGGRVRRRLPAGAGAGRGLLLHVRPRRRGIAHGVVGPRARRAHGAVRAAHAGGAAVALPALPLVIMKHKTFWARGCSAAPACPPSPSSSSCSTRRRSSPPPLPPSTIFADRITSEVGITQTTLFSYATVIALACGALAAIASICGPTPARPRRPPTGRRAAPTHRRPPRRSSTRRRARARVGHRPRTEDVCPRLDRAVDGAFVPSRPSRLPPPARPPAHPDHDSLHPSVQVPPLVAFEPFSGEMRSSINEQLGRVRSSRGRTSRRGHVGAARRHARPARSATIPPTRATTGGRWR